MLALSSDPAPARTAVLFGVGFLSQAGQDFGINTVIVGALLGAFCGFVSGLMATHLVRYVAFLLGRNFSGYSLAMFGMLAGALVFAWMTAAGNK